MTRIDNQRRGLVHMLSTLSVICIFAISALVLTNVGVRVYKNIAVSNAQNFELRTSLSFVATKVRQTDEQDMVYLDSKDGTPLLVMREEADDGCIYETIIYHHDGVLYELYQEAGSEYTLSSGMDILEISSFSIFAVNSHLIQLTAANSQGESESLYLNIRSSQEVPQV